MRIYRWWVAILVVVLCTKEGFTQQLRLGISSAANIKSAVLELQSTNQGLLFTRIADTALINTLNPPDGMVVYFMPTKRLLLRAGGAWQSLASTTSIDTTNIPNFYLKVRNELSGGTGINYNNVTGVISNAGVTTLNGNTGALTMDTGYISNFYQKVRGLVSAGSGITYNNTTGVITAGNSWAFNGNTVGALKTLGTVDNYDLPFITNNVERMRITGAGRVGIGVTNPANPLVVKDTFEIRRVGTLSTLLFTNTAGSGDFRIGSDGNDIFWQGGGGRNLQMGSYWPTILMGDRQSSSFPALSSLTTLNTGVLIPAQRDASVPLAIQANSATQSANLTEWRNSTGTVMDIVDETGSVAIGTSTFDGISPEKLLVDAGTTTSYNVISGKGSINNYLQLNIQNRSATGQASSDVVATADNGTELLNFIDMGINSSGYNNSGLLGGANTAYLYSTGSDFVFGNGTASKNLRFFTGGTATTNERMRIDGNGKVGINTTAPAATLDVAGTYKLGSSGTALNNMIKTTFSITDNNAFGLGTTKVITATVSGAATGATVILNPRSQLPTAVAIAYSYVSAANTITIGFICSQGVLSSSTLGSITFDVTLIQ